MLHLPNNFIKFSIPGRNEVQFKAAREFWLPLSLQGCSKSISTQSDINGMICVVTQEAELVKNKVLSSPHCHLSQHLQNLPHKCQQ